MVMERLGLSNIVSAILLLGAFLTPQNATADIKSCDDLAALEADPLAQSASVDFNDIQADTVIFACSTALNDPLLKEQNKGTTNLKARLLLQLGRGYLANGEMKKALAHFNQSADLGYPAGYFALGVFYLVGEDGVQNLNIAHPALMKAFNRGVIWAARGLSMLHRQQNTEFYDLQKAAYYQSLWEAR